MGFAEYKFLRTSMQPLSCLNIGPDTFMHGGRLDSVLVSLSVFRGRQAPGTSSVHEHGLGTFSESAPAFATALYGHNRSKRDGSTRSRHNYLQCNAMECRQKNSVVSKHDDSFIFGIPRTLLLASIVFNYGPTGIT